MTPTRPNPDDAFAQLLDEEARSTRDAVETESDNFDVGLSVALGPTFGLGFRTTDENATPVSRTHLDAPNPQGERVLVDSGAC